jgi:hypothetical protein
MKDHPSIGLGSALLAMALSGCAVGGSEITAERDETAQNAEALSCSGLPGWVVGTSYAGGAQVQEGGNAYQCKPWPYNGWCGQNTAYKPGEGWAWQNAWTLVAACDKNPSPGQIDVPVMKDAMVVSMNATEGSVPDKNFGAAATVDVATYHESAQGLFGYSLAGVPAGATVTKAELVIPGHYEATGHGVVSLSGVNQSSSWQEMTVTFNTTPASTAFGTFTIAPNVPNRLDVTTLVARAVGSAQTEVSFLLASDSSENVYIDSKEKSGGQPTSLHVEWQ